MILINIFVSTQSLLRWVGSQEGNVLFNNALNTFYLRLYGVNHMVKDHSDSERGNLLPPHRLLFPISSKGSFICIIPQTGKHIPQALLHQSWSTGWNEKYRVAQWVHHEGSIRRPIAPWANALTTELHLAPLGVSRALTCILATRGGSTNPVSSPCTMVITPIVRVVSPHEFWYTSFFSWVSGSSYMISNILEKFWPK